MVPVTRKMNVVFDDNGGIADASQSCVLLGRSSMNTLPHVEWVER